MALTWPFRIPLSAESFATSKKDRPIAPRGGHGRAVLPGAQLGPPICSVTFWRVALRKHCIGPSLEGAVAPNVLGAWLRDGETIVWMVAADPKRDWLAVRFTPASASSSCR
jgi:hypothetical protein